MHRYYRTCCIKTAEVQRIFYLFFVTFSFFPAPYEVHRFFTLLPLISYILCLYFFLLPTPYSLFPTPYSLLPIPYSLFPLVYDKRF
ncbi:hypothetical protein [Moorena producens]|uniref:hypothetical protein n=1 Tax=Moorena producens TaxID=1155739 RepID=UPI003C70725F